MLRSVVAAALLLTALSGCSGEPGTDETLPSTTATGGATTALVPIVRTDSLHFLEPPHLAGMLPENGALIRTPLPSDLGSFPGPVQVVTWDLPAVELVSLRASVRFVVEVNGVITPYSYPIGLVVAGACVWNVAIHVEGSDPFFESLTQRCFRETGAVVSGVRVLEGVLPSVDLPAMADERLQLSIWVQGAYSPGATVDLLSGLPESDSSVTIERLQVPLNTRTLTH